MANLNDLLLIVEKRKSFFNAVSNTNEFTDGVIYSFSAFIDHINLLISLDNERPLPLPVKENLYALRLDTLFCLSNYENLGQKDLFAEGRLIGLKYVLDIICDFETENVIA